MDACVVAKCVVVDLCHVVLFKEAVVVERKLEGVIVEGKPEATGASDVKVKVEVVVRMKEEVKKEVEVAVEVEMEVLA